MKEKTGILKGQNKRGISLQRQKGLKGWVCVSPFVLGFLLIYLWVFIDSLMFSISRIKMSFTGYSLESVGFDNYIHALRVDPDFTRVMVESITKMLTDIPTIIIFSLFMASVLNQKMKGRAIFRAIFFIPVILATGIIEKAQLNNLIMSSMSSSSGIDTGAGGGALASGIMQILDVNIYLQSLRFSPKLTEFVVTAIYNIYDVVNKSGVQMLVFLAGLQSISPSIYESASIEGATSWECFWKITFPMISPMIFVNTIYTIIDSFTSHKNPMIDMIYNSGFTQAGYGLASAMAWIYFAVIALCILTISALMYRFIFYQQKD